MTYSLEIYMLRFRLIVTTRIMFWYYVEATLLASWFTPRAINVRLCWHNYSNIIHNKQIYKHMLHRKKSNSYPT